MGDSVIDAYEAKTHLPRLLERVAKGERITITKHGVAVAILCPVNQHQQNAATAVAAMKAFKKGRSLKDLKIKDLIKDGRRF